MIESDNLRSYGCSARFISNDYHPKSVPRRPVLHVLPVGFERDRVAGPLIQDKLPADMVLLLRGREPSDETDTHEAFGARMVELVRRDLETFAGVPAERITEEVLRDVHAYDLAFAWAFEFMDRKLREGWDLFVNISSMPRTVSFAFATAANAMFLGNPASQGRITVYYAAPRDYLVTGLREQLRSISELLAKSEGGDGRAMLDAKSRLERLRDGIENYGMTRGIKPGRDGRSFIVIPPIPSQAPSDAERKILTALLNHPTGQSVADLTRSLAPFGGNEESMARWVHDHKSAVAYTLRQLAKKGFILGSHDGRRLVARLTEAGALWTRVQIAVPVRRGP